MMMVVMMMINHDDDADHHHAAEAGVIDTSCRNHRLVVPGKPTHSHISVGPAWSQTYHLLYIIFTFPWWNITRSANLRLLPDLKLAPLPIVHMSTLSMPTTLSTHQDEKNNNSKDHLHPRCPLQAAIWGSQSQSWKSLILKLQQKYSICFSFRAHHQSHKTQNQGRYNTPATPNNRTQKFQFTRPKYW